MHACVYRRDSCCSRLLYHDSLGFTAERYFSVTHLSRVAIILINLVRGGAPRSWGSSYRAEIAPLENLARISPATREEWGKNG